MKEVDAVLARDALPPPRISDERNAYVLGTLSVVAFALTLPFTKLLSAQMAALQIGLMRSLIAGIVALPILWVWRAPWPDRSQLKRLFLTSLGIVYGFPILTAVGMHYVPVSHGGVVLAALPLSTAIWGSLLTRQHAPASFWLVSVSGFLAVVYYSVSSHSMQGLYLGDLALCGAVVLAGMGYAQGGALSRALKGWQVMCWTLVISLPVVIVLTAVTTDFQVLARLDPAGWGALLFLALINSLFGFFTWNKALAMGGIQKISQLQLLQPFITYAFAIVMFGEALSARTVFVWALVIGLVALSRLTLARR